MDFLLLTATTALLAGQTLAFKEFNRRYMTNAASYFAFNTLYLAVVVIMLAVGGGRLQLPAVLTIEFGAVFGTLFVFATFSYMKAMESGPMSFASLFFSLGLLVPVVVGIMLWDETVSLWQMVGLSLLVVTLYLATGSSLSGTKGVNRRWVFFTAGAFIGNGLVLTTMKEHQMLLSGGQIREFLVIAFSVGAVLSGMMFLFYHRNGQSIRQLKKLPFVWIMLATATTTAAGNVLNLYLSTRISGVVQFPVVNGGVVLISTALSVILYRERLSRRGIASLFAGIAALVLVSIR